MQHEWPHKSVIPQLLDIENQRAFSNQFEITISDPEGSSDGLLQKFSFYATKVSLGSYTTDPERIQSVQRTIIKKATIPDTITFTVKETEDWAILKYFWKWYTSAYYNTQTNLFRTGVTGKRKTFNIFALASPYRMISVGAAEPTKQTYKFKITAKDALLVGAIQLPTFDYSVSDPITHSFTIQSDKISLEWAGEEIPSPVSTLTAAQDARNRR